MKRILSSLAVVAALIVSSFGIFAQTIVPDGGPPRGRPLAEGQFQFMHGVPMLESVRQVSGAPFSAQATVTFSQTLADGNQINRTDTALLARDSAGRVRRESTISKIGPLVAENGPRTMVNITDPVAGVSYVLDPVRKTAFQMNFHPAQAGALGNRERNDERKLARSQAQNEDGIQIDKESLGTQVMAGVNVEGTRTTETIPAGAVGNENPLVIVTERWFSPQLQETIYSKRVDPRMGTTVFQLANVAQKEPDPSLFQVPAGYALQQRSHGMMRGPGGPGPMGADPETNPQ